MDRHSVSGLDLARLLFEDAAEPAFHDGAPNLFPDLAFGLVGPGSECYRFDDEISRDHDWGPRLLVWMPDDLPDPDIQRLLTIQQSLPDTIMGYGPVHRTDAEPFRDGVVPANLFFQRLIGRDAPPNTLLEWLLTPEWALSLAGNGAVFRDGAGTVTAWREHLATYFPEPVWQKKIAVRLKRMGQTAQYNLQRTLRRDDRSGALNQAALFCREAAALVHHVHRVFVPVEKWLFRSLRDLSDESREVYTTLSAFAENHTDTDLLTSAISAVSETLGASRFSDTVRPFFFDSGRDVEAMIQDETIRSVPDSMV